MRLAEMRCDWNVRHADRPAVAFTLSTLTVYTTVGAPEVRARKVCEECALQLQHQGAFLLPITMLWTPVPTEAKTP